MKYDFTRGELYSRSEISARIGKAPPAGGNWNTGYDRHDNTYIVFCNVGTQGRTGHDYANAWDGSELVWYAKNGTRLQQRTIQRMISGDYELYLFWREDNRAPFRFAGLACAVSCDDVSPVRIRWRFE